MKTWFQNLKKEDREKRLFHFRGSIGADYKNTWLKYSFASGPALKLKYQHGEADDGGESSMLIIGLFFFTAYITFYFPKKFYFLKKCVATWDNNREFYLVDGREYGFYIYDWAFVWSWHKKINESSNSDPWWMHQYIHIDDLFLGKVEIIKDDLISNENVKFMLGGTEFMINSIAWYRYRRFRRFIPYSIYHKKNISVDIKIDKPPMHAGKGENSWDCGDDGSFGIHGPWRHPCPNYKNREESTRLAVEYYVESVMKDVRKRGPASGERAVNKLAEYKYIGREVTA